MSLYKIITIFFLKYFSPMKFRILLFSLLIYTTIAACKCSYTPTLESSFKSADFVFVGEIEGITEVPSGFKNSMNILSRVKIHKIYKSGYHEEFYKDTATLFASPIRSCDFAFTKKGKFLIFAYFEEDTGLLYSEHCLLQKRIDQLSPEELKELETLSTTYKKIPENSEFSANEQPIELIIDDSPVHNRKINELKKEISDISWQNNRYKIIIYVAIFVIVMLLIALILRSKRKKRHNL